MHQAAQAAHYSIRAPLELVLVLLGAAASTLADSNPQRDKRVVPRQLDAASTALVHAPVLQQGGYDKTGLYTLPSP